MRHARVLIEHKTGVFDPQGKVIHTGLSRLGHDQVDQVQVGKVIDLHFESGSREDILAQIDQMCAEFLVNPIIEDYTVEFVDE